MKKETNRTVINKQERTKLFCSICPPNKGCNKSWKKRGKGKPRYKDKR